MLILTRRIDEEVMIGGYIHLAPIRIRGNQVFFEVWHEPDSTVRCFPSYILFCLNYCPPDESYSLPVLTQDGTRFVEVRISEIELNCVRIGFHSPPSVSIDRFEIFERKQSELRQGIWRGRSSEGRSLEGRSSEGGNDEYRTRR